MMLYFVGYITFDVLDILDSAEEGCVIPFLAIFVLRYTKVHVCISNCSYEASYIEASVNQSFCFVTALNIPNIDPNDRFQEDFDNSRS